METVSALLAICAGNSPVTGEFPHKGQWRGALMFSLICAWINGWVNNREAGDMRRYCTHYDVIVMINRNTMMDISDCGIISVTHVVYHHLRRSLTPWCPLWRGHLVTMRLAGHHRDSCTPWDAVCQHRPRALWHHDDRQTLDFRYLADISHDPENI